jgi:hypothetical protein
LRVSAAAVEISGYRINEAELGTELLIHGRATDPGRPGDLRQGEAMKAPLGDDPPSGLDTTLAGLSDGLGSPLELVRASAHGSHE